jgi:nucleotide-binding universal stress UspA family protein
VESFHNGPASKPPQNIEKENSMTGTNSSSSHRIVVGVDGSESSMLALAWAVGQAELTHSSVVVVSAWHWPVTWAWEGIPMPEDFNPAEDAETELKKVLDPIRQSHPDVTIEPQLVEGHPAPALIEASTGSDLLVVGSRGHGEFAGMLIGSVSEYCVSNAKCPVLVFR